MMRRFAEHRPQLWRRPLPRCQTRGELRWPRAGHLSVGRPRALAEQQVPFAEPLRRLQTIPSVGPIVATTAIAIFSSSVAICSRAQRQSARCCAT